jgi:transcription-repair coupling factor (superfamily II helicase)
VIHQKIDAGLDSEKSDNIFFPADTVIEQALSSLKLVSLHKSSLVIFSNSIEQVDLLHAALRSLKSDDISLHVWSSWEHSPFSPVTSSILQKIDRLKTLSALVHSNKPSIIFCTPESWVQPTAPKHEWIQYQFPIKIGQDLGSHDAIRENLTSLGYVKSELVEEQGQFSVRGEIIDVFIPTETYPSRIELFDTVVEKIRYFHPETQRTIRELDSSNQDENTILITPAEEVVFPWNRMTSVLEKIKSDCDARSISRKFRDPVFENVRAGFLPENFRTWLPFVYEKSGFLIDYIIDSSKKIIPLYLNSDLFKIQIKQELLGKKSEEEKYKASFRIIPEYQSLYSIQPQSFEAFLANNPTPECKVYFEKIHVNKVQDYHLNEWLQSGYEIRIGASGMSTREHIKFIFKEKNIHIEPQFFDYDPENSYLIQDLNGKKTAYLSSGLFLGNKDKTNKNKSKSNRGSQKPKFNENSEALSATQDLSPGDLVVHTLHGIGKFIGLETIKTGESTNSEYLLIQYSGNDRLYLPVYRLNAIQKFVGGGINASLDKLGNGQFEKSKQKARESAKKLAINLVDLYAKRSILRGPKFNPAGEDYFEFCEDFEFEETDGQLKAIQDTFQDLESGKLLDRLVCGDVGFGKTEVAIRAAFQAVQSGYQVAVLVPTTLLAFQHEQSFKKRMSNFPITIESISRFKSKKNQTQTLSELKLGKIDIIIGTHRLLSKDIEFSKLGLLVVDEEHRFGVEHKEKIKAIQANTHTLTLTATPIPRTLNMALAGLKEMSLIRTPPNNRQSIKTFVSENSSALIKTAIENELARGGQVFFLSNRVQGIEHQVREIQELVPHAKVTYAHGQMNESEVEKRMLEFYQGYSQILVCTTIIESGIDVPNAGTILIDRADRLGLAQLYQIRGRVGRSHRKAFAYLLVNEERILTPEAKMRLDVLQRFVELGSGFHIASHDLEIRGGGNLLGAEQSGNIASVGLDLFIEMIEEAVQTLKGNKIDIEDRHFEPEIQVPVKCEISSKFISDSKLRLSIYRKISLCKNEQQLESIYQEMLDRFAAIPLETQNLFWVIRIRNLLKQIGVESLVIQGNKTVLTVKKQSLINSDEVMKLYIGPKGVRDPRLAVTPDSKILLSIEFESLQSHLFELQALFRKIAPNIV